MSRRAPPAALEPLDASVERLAAELAALGPSGERMITALARSQSPLNRLAAARARQLAQLGGGPPPTA